MNAGLIETAVAQFCSVSPTLLVWLGGTLLCAYYYERSPRRFVALGSLLSLMVVVSVGLPFVQYMVIAASSSHLLSLTQLTLLSAVASLVTTLCISVIPPVAVVLIALLTPAPEEAA